MIVSVTDKKIRAVLLIGIIVIAAFFRFPFLAQIPPGLYLDEAVYGNDGITTMENGDFQTFYPENYGREGMFMWLLAGMFRIAGIGVWQLRAVPAASGVLTVLALYFLTREITRRSSVAMCASFFLAIAFWHVNISRLGLRVGLMGLFLTLSFLFLLRAMRTGRLLYFVLLGFSFGLGMYTYIAFRIAVVLMGALFSAHIVRHHKIFFRWAIAGVVALVTIMPLAQYFLRHPEDFIHRAGHISVFMHEHPMRAFLQSAAQALGMFHIAGDPIWRHNIANAPMLSLTMGLFFLIGIFVVMKKSAHAQLRPFARLVLLAWIPIMLLPTALSTDHTPHALRASGILPAVIILAAIGAMYVADLFWKWARERFSARIAMTLTTACVVFVLAGMAVTEWEKYFVRWARDPETSFAFVQHHEELARYLQSLPIQTPKYIIVDFPGMIVDNFPISAQSLMFLLHETPNVNFLHTDEMAEEILTPNAVVIRLSEFEHSYRATIGKSE